MLNKLCLLTHQISSCFCKKRGSQLSNLLFLCPSFIVLSNKNEVFDIIMILEPFFSSHFVIDLIFSNFLISLFVPYKVHENTFGIWIRISDSMSCEELSIFSKSCILNKIAQTFFIFQRKLAQRKAIKLMCQV